MVVVCPYSIMMKYCIAVLMVSLLGTGLGRAVMFWETADSTRNTTTPGDHSGWQYEGTMNGFLGVPIAPYFFISAKHIAEHSVGSVFDFHGDSYTTIAAHPSPNTDLRIWEVAHSKPFPTFAPLSSGDHDLGSLAAVYGRGTQRGVAVTINQQIKGWKWGAADGVQRWGRNVVEGTIDGGASYGELLYCDFNRNGVTHECHLSVGDSGGGIFVLENGLWRLAGINLAVDGPFRKDASEGDGYQAALVDAGGMEYWNGASWTAIAESDEDVTSSFYATRIAASLPWIHGVATGSNVIATENFAAWQKLYFSPAQIADPLLSGPLADFDHDGVPNLVEYAFHLEPIFNEQKILDAGSGVSGLPLVRKENINDEERLTIEFLRRKNSNGAALTYVPEFSSDLTNWENGGSVQMTSLNDRWERVKVMDAVTRIQQPRRFGRVRVIMNE